jgi:hypothetical protein
MAYGSFEMIFLMAGVRRERIAHIAFAANLPFATAINT